MKTQRLLFAVLLATIILTYIQVAPSQAITIEKTRTFTSSSTDGYLETIDVTAYGDARNQSAADNKYASQTTWRVGQYKDVSSIYYVYRAYLYFDTSLLPPDASFSEATLSLYLSSDDSDTDYNVSIQNGQPTYPHDPLEKADYNLDYYSGDGGNRSTSTLTSGYWNITLTSTGITWLSLDGTTKLCVRSNHDIDNTAPTQKEYAIFYAAEQGADKAPKLYVTYTCEGYRYILHGPYYENGGVYPGIVNVTMNRQCEDSYLFILNGTGGVDEEIIQIEQQAISFTWNITEEAFNQTRTYCLTTESFEEIYVYVPNPDTPFYLYTFTVTDFMGVTNGYIETLIIVGDTSRTVERQSLAVINCVPFWMMFGYSYTLRLVCDEGTYTWGAFTALTEETQNLVITPGMFPTTWTGYNVTVAARRMNTTWIQSNYTDSQTLTSWVYWNITYRQGYTWQTAYTINNTGNTHTVNWHSADETTSYLVTVTASRDEETLTWSFPCPRPETTTNPWTEGFNVLGTWPIPAGNVLGLGIVLMCFGVFSYVSRDVGTVVAVLLAMTLTFIGWLQISWSLLALALIIAVLAAIRVRKKEEPLTT
jgi:hypothetical protein